MKKRKKETFRGVKNQALNVISPTSTHNPQQKVQLFRDGNYLSDYRRKYFL